MSLAAKSRCRPEKLTGSKVEAYVWPTNLDPSKVGFGKGTGTLALAITAHPDFDDTPLFDENGDGDPANDGADWHSHWVVLVKEEACGAGLKVRDVSPGVDLLPATAPHLPIALDSPGMSPILKGRTAKITVPVSGTESVAFDAVTARAAGQHQGQGSAALRHRRSRRRLRRLVTAGQNHAQEVTFTRAGRELLDHAR